MLLSAVSVLVVAQSSSEIPEGLMNNPVNNVELNDLCSSPNIIIVGKIENNEMSGAFNTYGGE